MAEENLCPKCSAPNPKGTSFCAKCGSPLAAVDETAQKDPFIGAFVGERFLVKQKLGEGGMGVVYEAEQTAIGRRVALKVLHPHLNDEELYARFRNEAAASSRLEHPNTITVYDFGRTDNDSLYIAMEFINGISLDDEIKNNGALDWQRTCKLGSQICGSLRNAHENGIIHRDMKPENIMLCERGDDTDFVKVLDFGIAKILDDDPSDQRKALTKTGMVFGTPQYMSPEQVRGEQIDARSDIYSVGIILYQMLTGNLPFNADTPMGLLTKHLLDIPPAFSSFKDAPHVPAELEQLVMKALSKEAQDRPQTMKEFGNSLDEFIGITHSGKTTVAGAVSADAGNADKFDSVSVESTVGSKSGKTGLIIIGSIVFLLVAGGALAAWFFMSGSQSKNGVAPLLTATDTNISNLDTGTANNDMEVVQKDSEHSVVADVKNSDTSTELKQDTETEQNTVDTDNHLTRKTVIKKPIKKPAKENTDSSPKSDSSSTETADEQTKNSLINRISGNGNCIFSAHGGKVEAFIARALRKKQGAVKRCIKSGTNMASFSYKVASGSNKITGVSMKSSVDAAQSKCLQNVVKHLVLSKPAPSAKSGNISFSTAKKDGEIVKCKGAVK